jgi:hypothetical protein
MTFTEYLNQPEIVKQSIGSVIVTDGDAEIYDRGYQVDVVITYGGLKLHYVVDPKTNVLMALDNRTQQYTMASCFRYSPKVTIKGTGKDSMGITIEELRIACDIGGLKLHYINGKDSMGITIVPKLATETELRIACGILGINPNKWQEFSNLF